MNSPLPASAPAPRRNWTRRLVNLLVALAVIAVAAAAFVFSYDGVHAIALLGGMSRQLARYYPGLFDAVLVIACVAAVMLREGRWWARLWAWIVAIVVLAAIGAADVMHAASFTLAHRTTEAIVAAAPVVAVLLAFSLLLTLLRPYRTAEPEPVLAPLLEVPALPVAASAPPIALPAAPVEAEAEAEPAAEDRLVTDAPPTVEYPAFAAAPEAPRAVVPEAPRVAVPEARPGAAHSATTPSEVIAPEAAPAPPSAPEARPMAAARPAAAAPEPAAPEPPTREVPIAAATVPAAAVPETAVPAAAVPAATVPAATVPAATVPAAAVPAAAVPETAEAQAPDERDEPAPPTVVVPALSPEPAGPGRPARGGRGIRYAGGAAPAAAVKQDAAEDDAQAAGYWEAADVGQLAGLVYRADQADAEEAADVGTTAQDGPAGGGEGDGDPASRNAPPEPEDDAPPFATAPFAAIPRLNRVRSTPTPPADEDEDEDD